MKRTGLLFLLFALVAVTAEAQHETIPGGLLYAKDGRAVFFSFETGKTSFATPNLPDFVIKPPFKASENGKKIVFLQGSKFYAQEMPFGIPYAVQAQTFKKKGNINSSKGVTGTPDKKEDIIWQREVKNLSISPDGARFAFEASHTAPGWILLDQGNPSSVARMMAAGAYANFFRASDPTKDDPRFRLLPLYVKRNEVFNGIFYLSTMYNQYDPPFVDPFTPVFGNVVERVPAPLFKATSQDLGMWVSPNTVLRPLGHGLMGIGTTGGETMEGQLPTPQTMQDMRCVKKNAGFLTFQKLQAWESGNKKAAFTYQIGNQYAIEIQTLDEKTLSGGRDYHNNNAVMGLSKNQIPDSYQGKARELEIQAMFPGVVAGLAWRPDGSLSIFTLQGDVYLVKAGDIQNAFNSSGMELIADEHDRKIVHPRSVNNVLRPRLELVAKGILGTCFNWVPGHSSSDYSLLFLGKDKNVYLWNQGKTEKIADSVGEFCYCSHSPFEGIKNPDSLAKDSINTAPGNGKKLADTQAISGTGKALGGNMGFQPGSEKSTRINFGLIQTMWTPRTKDSVRIWLGLSQKPLQFALLDDENDLGNVNDPSQYEYRYSQKQKKTVIDKIIDKRGNVLTHEDDITSDRDVVAPFDRIAILKLDNAYVAIKPVSLELRYKSVGEIPMALQKNWKKYVDKGEVPPIYDFMIYEWKYWPKAALPNKVPAQKAEGKEAWKISAVPIGKEFLIGDTSFSWEEIPEKQQSPQKTRDKFWLKFVVSPTDKDGYVGHAPDCVNTNILNPSKYDFRNLRHGENQTTTNFGNIWDKTNDYVLVLKIGEKYIAIKPLEERRGWIQYKWKYWPNAIQPNELAKTANN
jgi:hypothetical protein